MPGADVDVVIAIHDARRDIGRAVGSVLTSARVAQVVVVCHDLARADVAAALGGLAADARVRLEEFRDGVRSPAGPFNRGLELSRAHFTSIMGSDDEVAPGAIDAWVAAAERHGADVVIPRLGYAGGARVPTPPSRPGRRASLDGVRDRLAYRTAPLGLVSRARFGDLRFTPGLATGEDLAYSTRIWFSGASIALADPAAEYRIHDDAERVTFARRPIVDELAAVPLLLADDEVLGLPRAARDALAVKLWRVTVFGAVHHRAGAWHPGDREALAGLGAALEAFAPAALEVLARADRRLLRAILVADVPDSEVDAASRARRRFTRPSALVPSRLRRLFAREAPVRFAAATWLAGRA